MWIDPPIDLARLPKEPGVYRMLDAARKVLYVGKARNLKKRVSSYFQRRPDSPRIQAMVSQVRDVEFTITASEADALVLEHNLIKQLKPRYNVLLKDAKSYPYILLTEGEFPRLRLYRGRRDVGGDLFGPVPNAGAVHAAIELMQKIFRLRDCTDSAFRNRSRPCLQYQIGRCTAPCCGLVGPAEYGEQVRQARAFLRGEDQRLIDQWQREMIEAAGRRDFETAAALRDRIRMLRGVIAQGESALPDDADAVCVIRHGDSVACCVGVRRAGRDLGAHLVRIAQAKDATDQEILQSLLVERYARERAPALVALDSSEADTAELARLLRLLAGRKVEVRRPRRGPLRDWLREVRKSGEQNLAGRGEGDQSAALRALADLLGLPEPPARLAAVDNAHLGGRQTVAAIVHADANGPDKAHYRRYRLDDTPAGDDYA
ncbi:MAG: excinuclease ABC subunit UvrC, partial [Mariprofundaceae bacterium]